MASSDVLRHGVGLVAVFGIALGLGLVSLGADQPADDATTTAGESKVPDEWLEGTRSSRAMRFAELKVGENPPALKVGEWKNADTLDLADLKGKVVLLDFWATWCGPCLVSIPHTNDLYERYKGDGLVIIGVCHSRGADLMGKTAEDKGIKYPVAADVDGATVAAFAVDSFPDYYFIDRAGKLRILDCKNNNVEDAIKLLLAEKAKSK
ncbi:TlpA family protein disulfide reductase [Singulisphaera acidiphila]|uniref:Thiol-disulfide isomerase-like thioredoxin n=1 Tax=Singulisphaera acidiphila (strain ATCC BAA-1392 / DSM 18658 / VKM B-2454 / MOB10) TaxID=886293 RepID=L0DHH9_SINAD|nr:TlpA disulfide reductase family protein [Singulisphaera acidiphila]AGA28819.1 thiol-disulfide isomerase-like thioredoxin [Singulisphaera acidiphila DSM 18658]